MTAALKGNSGLSIGNLVGSNILNLLLVLGATAEVHDLEVADVVPTHDMWWMFGAAVVAGAVDVAQQRQGRLCVLYVCIYVLYVVLVVRHG